MRSFRVPPTQPVPVPVLITHGMHGVLTPLVCVCGCGVYVGHTRAQMCDTFCDKTEAPSPAHHHPKRDVCVCVIFS